MRPTAFFVAASLAIVMAAPSAAQSTDIDIRAADWVTLKATYSSPDRPGPGVIRGRLVQGC